MTWQSHSLINQHSRSTRFHVIGKNADRRTRTGATAAAPQRRSPRNQVRSGRFVNSVRRLSTCGSSCFGDIASLSNVGGISAHVHMQQRNLFPSNKAVYFRQLGLWRMGPGKNSTHSGVCHRNIVWTAVALEVWRNVTN